MKKKILFVLNCMGAGGIARSLSNFLFHLEKYKDKYDVDLFLFKQQGCYINDIPDYVNLLDEKKSMQVFGVSQRVSRNYGKLFYLKRMVVACWTKIFSNVLPLRKRIKRAKLQKKYDIAIAFAHTQNSHDMACGSPEFVLYGVDAKKKCMVCHGDVVVNKLLCRQNVKNYKKFDKVYSVSKSCSEQVKSYRPELSEVSDYLYNTQLNDDIEKKAKEEFFLYDKSVFNIVTLARLEKEKGIFRTLNCLKRLKEESFKFHWHIVGGGILESEIKQYLRENELLDCVTLHGSKNNPFPYVKNADLFLLSSFHEAAPMVYNEALQIGTPVFTTEIISSKEMIPQEYGFVCVNNEEALYNGLKQVLSNTKIVEEKRKNLKSFDYDNESIVRKFLDFID